MSRNMIRKYCLGKHRETFVLQGNIAFAVGCVRNGIHAVDGYPGTPSTEVIDKGLTHVQDLINVGWSVNEAVAVGVGLGHTLAGSDAIVTMKVPGVFQAGDVFTSSAFYTEQRGALIYYIASDFSPSSTQHLVDPRSFFKQAFVPVLEPRNHQEMMEFSGIAADIGRKYNTPVVILAGSALCHSEGLVQLNETRTVEKRPVPQELSKFHVLPGFARKNYETVITKRMPELNTYVNNSELNHMTKGNQTIGIITCGASDLFVREVNNAFHANLDILSLGMTHPVPELLIRKFYEPIDGPIYIFEDGDHFLQDAIERMGLPIIGKDKYSVVTEWTPSRIAEKLGYHIQHDTLALSEIARPPGICPGCPYRTFADVVAEMKKKKKLLATFGDIGCNTLIHYLDALDTSTAMGVSESKRQGFILSRPEMATKCLSIIGDGTECHSGFAATRNAIYKNLPGVKVILDNSYTAMTGGQPSPSSPKNIDGKTIAFDLVNELKGMGANVFIGDIYNRKDVQYLLELALLKAEQNEFVVLVMRGVCIHKVPADKKQNHRLFIDPDMCKKCGLCLVCPGIEENEAGLPQFNHNCLNCGDNTPSCYQKCKFETMIWDENQLVTEDVAQLKLEPAPRSFKMMRPKTLPETLRLAIRGVGGQGNIFFGKVLSQVAFLSGYGNKNIIKGETHGMAQLGGSVISTFSCGNVFSPILYPNSADILVAMEKHEILKNGFIELLKNGGTVLLNNAKIYPSLKKKLKKRVGATIELADDHMMKYYHSNTFIKEVSDLKPVEHLLRKVSHSRFKKETPYPTDHDINHVLKSYNVIELNLTDEAIRLGDSSAKMSNVMMLGALSLTEPFNQFPVEIWLEALRLCSPETNIWTQNYHAFCTGRKMIEDKHYVL